MFRIKILEDVVVFLLEKIADTVGQFGIPGKFGIAINNKLLICKKLL